MSTLQETLEFMAQIEALKEEAEQKTRSQYFLERRVESLTDDRDWWKGQAEDVGQENSELRNRNETLTETLTWLTGRLYALANVVEKGTELPTETAKDIRAIASEADRSRA